MKNIALLLACAVMSVNCFGSTDTAVKANEHKVPTHFELKMKQAKEQEKAKIGHIKASQKMHEMEWQDKKAKNEQLRKQGAAQQNKPASAEPKGIDLRQEKMKWENELMSNNVKNRQEAENCTRMRVARESSEKQERLDSILDVDVDGKLLIRGVYQYDENGRLVELERNQYLYAPDVEEDCVIKDKYCYEYLEDQKQIYHEYNWDDQDETWIEKFRQVSQYDDAGYSLYYEYWSYNKERKQLLPGSKSVWAYDSEHRTILNEYYFGNAETGEWVGDSKNTYSYVFDENGTLTYREYTVYKWNFESKDWISNDKYVYALIEDKQRYEEYKWDANEQDWVERYLQVTKYDERGNTVYNEWWNWDDATQTLCPCSIREFEYDQNDRQIVIKEYSWNAESMEWYLILMQKREYDDKGYTVYEELHNWDNEKNELVPIYLNTWEQNDTYYKFTGCSWDYATEDWYISSLYEFESDERGNTLMSKSMNWNESENMLWGDFYNRYEYDENDKLTHCEEYWFDKEKGFYPNTVYDYGYDAQGTEIMGARYSYDWSCDKLVGDYKYEREFNENGDQTLRVDYYWDNATDTWCISVKEEWVYENGRLMSNSYWLDDNWTVPGFELITTVTYEYDENGDMLQEVRSWQSFYNGEEQSGTETYDYVYTLSEEDGLIVKTVVMQNEGNPQQKFLYYYQDTNLLKKEFYTVEWIYDEVNDTYVIDYTLQSMVEWEYDANGNRISETESWFDHWNQIWTHGNKYLYGYDESGVQNMEGYATYVEDLDEYVTEYTYCYAFDDQNRQIYYETKFYDIYTQQISWGSKWMNAYDEYGNKLLDESYYWSSDYSDWMGDWKTKAAYDEYGNCILDEAYSWDWNHWDWRGQWKSEWSYDKYGNRTMYASYYWDDILWNWFGNYRTDSEYDEEGNYITSNWFIWDSGNNEWTGNKWVNLWDEDDNYLGYEMLVYKNGEWIGVNKVSYIRDYESNTYTSTEYLWDTEANWWYEIYRSITYYKENGNVDHIDYYKYNEESKSLVLLHTATYYYSYGSEENGISDVLINEGEDVIYRLDGTRVFGTPTRGIYIINGKKVFVK